MSIVTADIWSGIEAVITSTTGNRVTAKSRPRVRIPPTAPYEHHPCFELFYRNTGGFLFGKPCIAGLSAFYK